MDKQLGIGLMSGTSLDGIDAVLIEIEGSSVNTKVKVIDSLTHEYESDVRHALKELCFPETASLEKICSMNMFLGRELGMLVNKLLDKASIGKEEVLFVSSHGQTIFHKPLGGEKRMDVPGTLQIGDLSMLSEITGITAVGDFRTADMSAGGQGAPLVSFVDYILFNNPYRSRAIQNIGGIGNVTYIPRNAQKDQVMSFDTGPGNMVIDEIVYRITESKQVYDKDGEIASKGNVNQKLLNKLMEHPYLKLRPPKTTGRELFGNSFVDSVMSNSSGLPSEDIVATVTAWTAKTIADSYSRFIESPSNSIDDVVIGGGGSYNPFLMEQLRRYLPNKTVYKHEDFQLSSNLKEAIAFAILGYHCLIGKSNQIPSATGAENPVIMGKISHTQPQAFQQLSALRGNLH
ncbi:anhydro-N-acetylmuramic acid kinase [Sediminibacillus halophilus]|uniref:Anhydro-N-acetylmuramic acid kinase n=1 Tax=Sediminibacillus halophilus TaxID=482461 RepID=A0A1G9RF43_9BACI|nr:anhydro-N-acetylmuramic acid kinase [Sediminibacillus halophilus]SDM21846.1 anhydro-N-acetylmuramic acid kinase [Sediminibacillus halophilus]